jgi:hypothetical protein
VDVILIDTVDLSGELLFQHGGPFGNLYSCLKVHIRTYPVAT